MEAKWEMRETATKLKMPTEVANQIPGIKIGEIVGESEDGRPMVRWAGQHKPKAAMAVWMRDVPQWSTCEGLRAVLGFPECDDKAEPLLLGLVDEPPQVSGLVEVPGSGEHNLPSIKPKVVKIESEQELILQCGQARIALHADGRLVILGGYVLSRSKGVNKIKGGSVQIN